MKNILFIFINSLCFLHAASQTRLAFRAGLNYSSTRAYFNNVKQETGYVPGANAGLQLNTVFERQLHFSPIISYNLRGFIIHSDSIAGDQQRNLIHYINIAPLLSYHFKTGLESSVSITGGPMGGVAISGTQKTTTAGRTISSKMSFSTSKDYGLIDLGLHGSIGYHLKKLFLEICYDHGLASINNNEEMDKKNIRNRTISLSLGYYFKSYK